MYFRGLFKRRLLLALVAVVIVYAAIWVAAYAINRDPVRDDAVALFERLRPGMTAAEFLDLTKGEPIDLIWRVSLAVQIPGDDRPLASWTHADRFRFITSFDRSRRLIHKEVVEIGCEKLPSYVRYAEQYFGIPGPKLNRYWHKP